MKNWIFLAFILCQFFRTCFAQALNQIDDPQQFFASAVNSRACFYCNTDPIRILYETENFRVLINTFPIAPGHIMISGKQHLAAMGALNADCIQELLEIKEKISCIYDELFKGVVFYEHGRMCICENEASNEHRCSHFHLNCLPATVCMHKNIQLLIPQFYSMQSVSEVTDLYKQFDEYLYFENSEGRSYFYPISQKIPSHFIRTLLCDALLVPERSNWKKHKDFSEYLENYALCQEKIKKAFLEFN